MGHSVGVAKTTFKSVTTRNITDGLASDAVSQQHAFDQQGLPPDAVTSAKSFQDCQCIGGDLQASAHLAELLGLLADHHLEVPTRQSQGAGEATNATSSDHDRPFISGEGAHRDFPLFDLACVTAHRATAARFDWGVVM